MRPKVPQHTDKKRVQSGRRGIIQRCRPVLGTYVEVTAEGEPDLLLDSVEKAFEALQRVHQLMSIHDSESELSRVNREALNQAVTVDGWTWRVLQAAWRLSFETSGAFDVTFPVDSHAPCRPSWHDLQLISGRRVHFLKPLRIDLGGIAKGFGVDMAIHALRRGGVVSGKVNAGGDVRLFGSAPQFFQIRHPRTGAWDSGHEIRVREALATSATTFSRRREGRRWVTDLWNPLEGEPVNQEISVSVTASTCLWADALTKVVLVLGDEARPVLRRHRAQAWVLGPSNEDPV